MNISWPDLPGALLLLGAGLLIVAGLIGLVVWGARRRRSPAVIVDVAGAIARMWVAFTGLIAVFSVWRWVSGGDTWIPGVPVRVNVPGLSCEGSGDPIVATTPTLVCGHIDTADLTVAGLDGGLRMLLASGDLLLLVAAAVPGIVLAIACSQTLKGVPFTRVVSRWLLIGAVVVLVAGLGSELLGSLGRSILTSEIFPVEGVAVSAPQVYSVSISFWPIAAAFGLGALGAIFRHGERLQHETAGLV